ncbi:MAG: bifunctional DNA primase/polymerase [Candidatus Korobacteraceae bacterium]|jgi:putative DNA primase/helicase
MNTNQKGAGNELRTAALDYANKGIPVFPLKPGDKTPIYKGSFHNATTDPTIISQWWDETPDANIGVPMGEKTDEWTLDVDVKNEVDGYHSLQELEAIHGPLPKTRRAYSPNGGTHFRFKYPGVKVINRTKIAPGIDVRGDGGYVVVPPSRLEDGKTYRWDNLEEAIAEAPLWLLDLVVEKPKSQVKPVLFELQENVIPNGSRNDTFIRMAGGLRRYGADEEQIFGFLWDTNINRCSSPLDESEVRTIAASAMRWEPAGHEFPLTDAGNAELFAYLNNGQLLYDHNLTRWLVWQKHWWAEDNTGEVTRRAKQAARERQHQAANLTDDDKRKDVYKYAIKSENRSRIEACIELAKCEPSLSDAGDTWDTNPWLLGVENGVVDLKSGQLREGNPSDRISLHANVAYDPTVTCPRWEQFMEEIFLGNRELIAYVQRAVGYSLTGLTTEHVMFLAYGNGANGKSVMLRVLCELLGR